MFFRQSIFAAKQVRGVAERDFKSQKREARRLKTINTLTPDFTGESGFQSWLEPKRLRALVKMYEEYRNKHRFTVKVENKDKVAIKQQMERITEIEYGFKIRREYFLKQQEKVLQNTFNEIQTLPPNLYNNLKEPYGDVQQTPDILEDFNIYYEQLMRINPEPIAFNLKLAARLLKIGVEKGQILEDQKEKQIE